MSLQDSNSDAPKQYRKPRADVYTVLLVLALIAIILGILCLHFEMDIYDYKIKGGPSPSASIDSAAVAGQYLVSRQTRVGQLGTGPFFGCKALFARKMWAEKWTCPLWHPLAMRGGQSHFRGEIASSRDKAQCAAKIGTVPCERLQQPRATASMHKLS